MNPIAGKILKYVSRGAAVLLALVLLIVIAAYLPFVQDYAVEKVLNKINNPGEFEIIVSKARIGFPLDLKAEGVKIIQQGDTTVSVGKASAEAGFWSLFWGEVEAENVEVTDVRCKIGNPDSLLFLSANLKSLNMDFCVYGFSSPSAHIGTAEIASGDIKLALKNDTTQVAETDTVAEPLSMMVYANALKMKDISALLEIENVADTISCTLPSAEIYDGTIDLGKQTVSLQNVKLNSLDAAFIYPLETVPTETKTETESLPWTVNVGKISLADSKAKYAASGAVPADGFDFNYIALNEINITVDSLLNRGSDIRIPSVDIRAKERSGLGIYASGSVEMDSLVLALKGFGLETDLSRIEVDAEVGIGESKNLAELPLNVVARAKVAQPDIIKLFPEYEELITSLPQYSVPEAAVAIHGTMAEAVIDSIYAALPRHFELFADGRITNITDFDKMAGNVSITGDIRDAEKIKRTVLSREDAKVYFVPDVTLTGKAKINAGTIDCTLSGVTETGDLALDASINANREKYAADLSLNTFPLQAFLPSYGVKDISAKINASADGIDPFDPKTTIKAEVDVDSVTYNGRIYTGIFFGALINAGNIDVNLTTTNPDADLSLNLSGIISPQPYSFDYSADIRNFNLKAMDLTESEGNLSGIITGHATLLPDSNFIDADVAVNNLNCRILPSTNLNTAEITAHLLSTDSLLDITLDNSDLKVDLKSRQSLSRFTESLLATVDTLNKHIERQRTDILSLQETMPPFVLDISAKHNNIITSYLTGNNIRYNSFDLKIDNDSLFAIDGNVMGIKGDGFALDTTKFVMRQMGKYLTMKLNADNLPGTMDEWAHVEVNGFIADAKMGLFMRQSNISNKIGYRFGTMANIQDSTLNVSFVPYDPVIAYKEWNINDGNLLSFDFRNMHLDADLLMKSEESLVHLFTEHVDSMMEQEDLNLKVENIKIADWIALNPYAPKIKGDLYADMKVRYNERQQIEGSGKASLKDFYFGKQRVGTFDCDLDLTTDRRGRIEATASMDVDGQRAMTAYGHIADSTAVVPFLADFELTHFPLKVINPFLPQNTAKISGELSGQMDITGSTTEPKFNGYLRFDSTMLYVNMIATNFKFDGRAIPIDSNVVYFDKFKVKAINDNPLTVDGYVNMKNIFNPIFDLALTSQNMQVVNSTRASKGAEVYGKAFIDLDSRIKGDLNKIDVNAVLDVLPQTNVTYVMTDAQSTIQARQKSDMVKFVNLQDTSAVYVEPEPEETVLLDLNASLKISEGATINADLSTDGKNKVSLKTNGQMNYKLSAQGDEAMTGRLNITGGFARYSPPLMSEKLFNFADDGNYILFTGDMMNPTIKLHAVDNLKANVTQEGQNSRVIEFDISLDVTGSLERMNVTFDLATNDDITIQNELQSMSAEQRATQAMNLLLYNVYTGPGTKASSSLSANPLYTFLESQVNTWAANNIKGVDLSFGIDQYNKTTDGSSQTTTNYSYKVSKTLFNDRFKIVVGGNYSDDTDSDADIAAALLNDVSFEYSLNPEGTMVIKIYRHTGYEDVLEGEITQTGAGFVYKRKILRFSDIFRPNKKKTQTQIDEN